MPLRSLREKLVVLRSAIHIAAPHRGKQELLGKGKTPSTAWKSWLCATVLALFAMTTLEREHQLFQDLVEAPEPVGHDFAVYYVAGRVALGEGDGAPTLQGGARRHGTVESTEVRRGGAGARVGDRGADQLINFSTDLAAPLRPGVAAADLCLDAIQRT